MTSFRKAILCYLTVFFLTILLLLGLRLNQDFLPSGSSLKLTGEQDLYTLTEPEWIPEEGICRVIFTLEEPEDVTLAIIRSAAGSIQVRINETDLRDLYYYPDNRQIGFLNLNAEQIRDLGGTVRLEILTGRWGSSDQVYLGTNLAITQTFLLNYRIIRTVGLTALIIMLIYGLSLYWFKKSEQYLRHFLAYMALLILWLSMTGSQALSFLPEDLYNFIQVCGHCYVAYAPFVICVQMSETPIPEGYARFFRWEGFVLVPLLLGVLAYCFNFSLVIGCLLLLCLIYGGYTLAERSRLQKPGTYILIIGFAVMLGMKILALLVDYGLLEDGLLFFLMRKSRFLNLPFSMAVMLFVNKRFAGKFQEAEDLSCSLEQKVQERTAELHRQQNLRRGMMLNMFHDLRSPLFTIRTCLSTLTGHTPKEQETLDLLADRVEFLSCLTEDLFESAKLEDDDLLFSQDPVNLSDVLHHTIQAAAVLADRNRVLLSYEEQQTGYTWGDASRLARAFQNLIVNAIQYTPPGGQVRVSFSCEDGQACIRVKDSGKGIAPEDLAHIFERYYHKNETTPNHSTGLGLSIAHSIIQKHEGTIRVTSRPGEGSLFLVTLPLWEPEP